MPPRWPTRVNYVGTDRWRTLQVGPPIILPIDIDPAEAGNNDPVEEGLCGDARLALADVLEALQEMRPVPVDRGHWFDEVAQAKANWLAQLGQADDARMSAHRMAPHRVISGLRQALRPETVVTTSALDGIIRKDTCLPAGFIMRTQRCNTHTDTRTWHRRCKCPRLPAPVREFARRVPDRPRVEPALAFLMGMAWCASA